jgi:hypothetical protein
MFTLQTHSTIFCGREENSKRTLDHRNTMRRLKEALHRAVWLKKSNYDGPIIVIIDTSPTKIGSVMNPKDVEGNRYLIQFGANILNNQQRKCVQVKRELWCTISVIKTDWDYLTRAEVMIEIDCLPVLGMLQWCTIPDVTMLRWVIT